MKFKIPEKKNLEKKIPLRDLKNRLDKYDYAYFVIKHKESGKTAVKRGFFGGMSIYINDKKIQDTKWEPVAFFTDDDLESLNLEVPDWVKDE